jgi:hypothetical protein
MVRNRLAPFGMDRIVSRDSQRMAGLAPEIVPIRKGLLSVGFREDRLRSEVPIPDSEGKVPLLGFADEPFDSRTACVAAIHGRDIVDSDIAALRPLGAPLVFASLPDHFQFWTQRADRPVFERRLTASQLPRFFDENRNKLAPESIYRAKAWGRLERSFQLEFVDAGLMPLVEEEAGRKLTDLIERTVTATKKQLGLDEVSDADGRWLLQSVFWLLAAKILQDKEVPGFVRLDLTDLEKVYERLARHYNSQAPRPVPVGGRAKREALVAAAEDIRKFGHCGSVSTEALAYLYESALITRETRRKLGTHSTPTWLVDYIVGRLRTWIEEIPVGDRRVFEPACGHAAFLMSAMRLLTEILPPDWHEPRRTYLRRRLRGVEVDSFALEIARLSLTLADVPNPNGWALVEGNMLREERLESGVREATIVLANPPFENFDARERRQSWLPNKAAETFRRVVENLRQGVFGFVLPQTFLRSKQAVAVRELLVRDYEISEISLFADKVFRYGESESAVVIGRRRTGPSRPFAVRYQRIREGQIDQFSRTYQSSSGEEVETQRLRRSGSYSLYLPELYDVWDALSALPKLGAIAHVAKGLEHKSEDDPTMPPGTIRESPVEVEGLIPGFAGWMEGQMTHRLPIIVWLNLASDAIRRPGSGTERGTPQVLLNYARVSREAWRLKALLDPQGHPVTSDFLVVRPRTLTLRLEALWGLLNSPVGNAFAYCHSSKRHVLAGDMRRMPVPDLTKLDLGPLEQAVAEYLAAARGTPVQLREPPPKKRSKTGKLQKSLFSGAPETESPADEAAMERLRTLHWRIDAEVLRLYDLPADLERKVLGLFTGIRRRGVPFEQTQYFPKDFTDLDRLSDLLAITADWPKTNRRRAKLIDLEEEGRLTPAQAEELENLQRLADASVSLLHPVQMEEADRIIEDLKRRGLREE